MSASIFIGTFYQRGTNFLSTQIFIWSFFFLFKSIILGTKMHTKKMGKYRKEKEREKNLLVTVRCWKEQESFWRRMVLLEKEDFEVFWRDKGWFCRNLQCSVVLCHWRCCSWVVAVGVGVWERTGAMVAWGLGRERMRFDFEKSKKYLVFVFAKSKMAGVWNFFRDNLVILFNWLNELMCLFMPGVNFLLGLEIPAVCWFGILETSYTFST